MEGKVTAWDFARNRGRRRCRSLLFGRLICQGSRSSRSLSSRRPDEMTCTVCGPSPISLAVRSYVRSRSIEPSDANWPCRTAQTLTVMMSVRKANSSRNGIVSVCIDCLNEIGR